jgi:hypothetical protein
MKLKIIISVTCAVIIFYLITFVTVAGMLFAALWDGAQV